MNKIENLRIIKHFKDNVKGDIHGIYECNVNEKKMLLVRHGMEIASISFFIGKPLGECIMNVRKDIAMDIEKEVDAVEDKKEQPQVEKSEVAEEKKVESDSQRIVEDKTETRR